MPNMSVSDAIRLAYEGRATQQELAEALGISQPSVSDLIRRGDPKLSELVAIEQAADRPPGFILRAIGYLEQDTSVVDLIKSDPAIPDDARSVVLASYWAAKYGPMIDAFIQEHSAAPLVLAADGDEADAVASLDKKRRRKRPSPRPEP